VISNPIAPDDQPTTRSQHTMLPNHQIKTAAALTLALAAITPAAATARPLPGDPPQSSSPRATPTVRVITPQTGFDWGDAGIGAAGGFALSMLGLGGALILSQRRGTRPERPSAISG
jgi:hypothetical protein